MKYLNSKLGMMLFACTAGLIVLASCSGGGDDKAEGVQLSEKGKLLMSTTWKPDVNATIKESTDAADSATTIKADIQLQGDVKTMTDFVAGTLLFGKDTKDPSKLSYKRTYGKGILSSSVLGYWNFNEDESMIEMREWDSQAGKEKPAKKYEIIELTADKLVLKGEGAITPDVYIPN